MMAYLDNNTELKTSRLLLRPFRPEDVDDVFDYASDPEWSKYFPTVPVPYLRRDAEEFLERTVVTSWETKPVLAIVLASTVIGGVSVRVDLEHETGELGYGIGTSYWGQGFTSEAVSAVIDWAFDKYSLAKVHARSDVRNVGSQRVMEKAGMAREGVLRSQAKRRGIRVDYVYYGILRQEWDHQRVSV